MIDIDKVKIEIPTENFDTGSSDIMKDIEKGAPGGAAPEGGAGQGKSSADREAEDLQKALGGK